MGFFKDFHDQGKFVKSINASFMVLIPKKGGAEDLKDFRSISLVGSLYKLLAKVLANRLKKVMGKLVSKTVHFQRGADHSYKKCLGQYANLPNVYISYA